jgi:hypothetical protein
VAIENAQVAEDLDLNLMLLASLALIQADAARKPLGYTVPITFRGLVATVGATRRTFSFVVPDDVFVETIGAMLHDMVGDVTVQVTGDGGVAHFPVTITGTSAGGTTLITRVKFDGTLSRVDDTAMPTAPVFRVWPKGTTITIVVSTTNVVTACKLDVHLCLRTFLRRSA